ncbi:acetylcholinesterase-1-like [Ixodes scapularis]
MSEATSLPHEMASLTSSPRTSAASLPEGRAQTFNLRADSSCQSLEYDYSQTFKKTTANRNAERHFTTGRVSPSQDESHSDNVLRPRPLDSPSGPSRGRAPTYNSGYVAPRALRTTSYE